MDEVGLLSRSAQTQIADQLFQIRGTSGPQIQVFITSSLQGESTEQVAIQLFDKWKLGDVKKDNGLIFLIAPKEKRMRIEVGRGLEGDLPDVIAKRIIDDVVSPFFKRGEFDMGVAQGVAAIGHYLNATPEQKAELQQNIAESGGETDAKGGISGLVIFLVVLAVWILLFIFNPTFAIYLLFSMFSGGGGRGGSGGGGNWSGGGGGSSGGGASGGW